MTPPSRPPEELSDGSVSLRRFRTADAESLHEAVVASTEHLRPWMPWLSGGAPTVDGYRVLIDDWWEAWSAREGFAFRICDPGDPNPTLGVCGLHARIAPGGLDLGYWVRADRTREGLATAAGRLATGAALSLDGIDHVEIHHDTSNTASSGVPSALGFALMAERPKRATAPAETGTELVWRTDRHRWEPPATKGAASDD